MAEQTIEKPEELISHIIGKNKKVVETKISRLTAPGENNLSLVLKVDYVVKDEEFDVQEEIHGVAKVILPSNKFRFEANYKSETGFYEDIVPTLQKFQKEQGVQDVVDLFPILYNARPNLHGKNDEVDENAVILLENLAVLGYKNVDRYEGFDLETTKLILKNLATFHALPLAIKTLHPEVFKSKISPHFSTVVHPPPPPEVPDNRPRPELVIVEVLQRREELAQYWDLIETSLTSRAPQQEPRGLLSSISHGDMWVNNIMIKYENNKPIKNKFLDFQMYNEKLVAKDLVFFLFTSVRQSVLEGHLDYLIKFYYDNLIETLKQHKCNIDSSTFEEFLKDVSLAAKLEFEHILSMMLFVVFGKKKEESEYYDDSNPHAFMSKENTTPMGVQKAIYTSKEFIQRRWLQ